jgi:hypothetical protein
MFHNSYDDLTLATMADYDRLVNRLLLESDARNAHRENQEYNQTARPLHHWWEIGQRRHGSAA